MDIIEYGYENGYLMNEGDQTQSTIELHNEKYGNGWNDFSIWCGFKNFSKEITDIVD